MDPQAALNELLAEAEYYRRQTDPDERVRVADGLVERLLDLRDWTANGGYEPSWPQRPLTDGELAELHAAGHRG
jgi:hypothetical protein